MHSRMSLRIAILWLLTNACLAFEDTPSTEPVKVYPVPPFTATFDVTTNYLSQGVSNSNNKPAVQGGVTYNLLETGIYLNLWGSTTRFIAPDGHYATIEIDEIIGYNRKVNNNFNYTLYVDHYEYPRANSANYTDVIGLMTYRALTATAYYSMDVFGTHEIGMYLNGAINYDLPNPKLPITLLASIGHYQLPNLLSMHSYFDFMIGVQKIWGPCTLSLQLTDTTDSGMPDDGFHIVGTLLLSF